MDLLTLSVEAGKDFLTALRDIMARRKVDPLGEELNRVLHEIQLGKGRHVFDYSLAYIGPSELFRHIAARNKKVGAKLQVGCSHENASVPFIPVPGNLYEKYKTMHELGVYAAMQCWYFGNYPGLMNRAAGMLAREDFANSDEDDFLVRLARPEWGEKAPAVAAAVAQAARESGVAQV